MSPSYKTPRLHSPPKEMKSAAGSVPARTTVATGQHLPFLASWAASSASGPASVASRWRPSRRRSSSAARRGSSRTAPRGGRWSRPSVRTSRPSPLLPKLPLLLGSESDGILDGCVQKIWWVRFTLKGQGNFYLVMFTNVGSSGAVKIWNDEEYSFPNFFLFLRFDIALRKAAKTTVQSPASDGPPGLQTAARTSCRIHQNRSAAATLIEDGKHSYE
ncbi:hypothetical protein Taro_003396 [Colocasia esculenta]|uniref:Uncharacterized protein n=1 Tax=Colocasia esculenta TaxID=4460 RepID=A0A843TF99_COLES|nr:hypothetical protein [Colocasia esculenta]